jgi:hypothetical protein
MLPMSQSINIHKKGATALQSFNRYVIMSAAELDTAYHEPEYLYQLQSSTQVVQKPKVKGALYQVNTTAATSNYLTFEDNQHLPSPRQTRHLQMSKQNALLSIMSQDDLEGIK